MASLRLRARTATASTRSSSTVLGFGILTASHLAIDRLVLPMQKLAVEIVDDHNWGAALLHGVVTLGIVICVNSFYRYQLLCGDEYL